MTTVPLSEAKNRLSELVDSVQRTHERVSITKNGRETVMLIATQDFEALGATLELLLDPAAQERVRISEQEIAAGDVVTGEELTALMWSRRASS